MTPEEFNSKHRKNLCFDLFIAGVTILSTLVVFGWSFLFGVVLGGLELGLVLGATFGVGNLGVCAYLMTDLSVSDRDSYFVALFLVLYHRCFKE